MNPNEISKAEGGRVVQACKKITALGLEVGVRVDTGGEELLASMRQCLDEAGLQHVRILDVTARTPMPVCPPLKVSDAMLYAYKARKVNGTPLDGLVPAYRDGQILNRQSHAEIRARVRRARVGHTLPA